MNRNIEISGKNYKLRGKLFLPKTTKKIPAVIFYHGMVSQIKPRTVERAKKLTDIGIATFAFDFRGCGQSDGKLGKLSISDWFDDALMAFDFLNKQKFIDKNRIGIAGKSFGGYMGALVCKKRNVKSMVLQAPAVYPDSHFKKPYELSKSAKSEKLLYRLSKSALKNKAIHAIRKYKNPLLVIGSELDDTCPKNVVEGYYNESKSENKKMVWIKNADHALTKEVWNMEYTEIMIDWFKKTL